MGCRGGRKIWPSMRQRAVDGTEGRKETECLEGAESHRGLKGWRGVEDRRGDRGPYRRQRTYIVKGTGRRGNFKRFNL